MGETVTEVAFITVKVEGRATLNSKGTKAVKAFLHVHGRETHGAWIRGRNVGELADQLNAIEGVTVEVPDELRDVPARLLDSVEDQAVTQDGLQWHLDAVKLAQVRHRAAQAAEKDAARQADVDDGPGAPPFVFNPDDFDEEDGLVLIEHHHSHDQSRDGIGQWTD